MSYTALPMKTDLHVQTHTALATKFPTDFLFPNSSLFQSYSDLEVEDTQTLQ